MDFEDVFAKHHVSLYRYVHRLVGDADVAADIAQESFVRLLEQDVSQGKAKSWLFTVATNLVRDRARTRSRRSRLLDRPENRPDPPEGMESRLERSERVATVRRVLDELAPRDRKILLMREEGFRYAEIAEAIDVATSSVGTLLARALRRFEEAYRSQAGVEADGDDGPGRAGQRETG